MFVVEVLLVFVQEGEEGSIVFDSTGVRGRGALSRRRSDLSSFEASKNIPMYTNLHLARSTPSSCTSSHDSESSSQPVFCRCMPEM